MITQYATRIFEGVFQIDNQFIGAALGATLMSLSKIIGCLAPLPFLAYKVSSLTPTKMFIIGVFGTVSGNLLMIVANASNKVF